MPVAVEKNAAAPVTIEAASRKHTPAHRTWVKWAIGAAALAAAAATAFVIHNRGAAEPRYVTARIDRGDIASSVNTTGNLNAVVTVQVGSQVSGNIIALYADFNTQVKKGQLVALIDPAPFQAAVDQARASLSAANAAVTTAEAALAKSQADVATAIANVAAQNASVTKAQSAAALAGSEATRRQVMFEQDATSREDYESARSAWEQAVASVDAASATVTAARASVESARKAAESAKAQLDQAKALAQQDQAALAQAQLNLDHTRILAPVDGTVESRNMDVGQTVAASFQAPTIFLIAQDLTKMQVDTNVDEADVARVRVGQKATFTVDAYPGEVFTGTAAQIRQAPINVQNVITYDVVIAVSNADLKLFPGMTANATIFTGRASNAIRIPKAALRFRPRQTTAQKPAKEARVETVYSLTPDGAPYPIPVKLGLSDANYSQLVSGDLSVGQQVVVGMTGGSAAPAASRQPATPGRRLGF